MNLKLLNSSKFQLYEGITKFLCSFSLSSWVKFSGFPSTFFLFPLGNQARQRWRQTYSVEAFGMEVAVPLLDYSLMRIQTSQALSTWTWAQHWHTVHSTSMFFMPSSPSYFMHLKFKAAYPSSISWANYH